MDDYLTSAFAAIEKAADTLGARLVLSYSDQSWTLAMWKPHEGDEAMGGAVLLIEDCTLRSAAEQACADLGLEPAAS